MGKTIQNSLSTVKILIIDNDDEFIDVYKMVLEANESESMIFDFCISYTLEDGYSKFKSYNPDIIILDHTLPGSDGEDICAKIRASKRKKYTSIIVASNSDSPQNVVKAFNNGADDFCSKKNAWVEIPARIKSALRIKLMQESLLQSNLNLKKANKKLQYLSESDELTGLANMRYFKKRLAQEFSRSKRYRNNMSILMIDIDFFKNVNDTSNHLVGSHVLAEVGKIISDTLRNHDIGARFGGDEYVAILTQTDEKGTLIVAERLLELISNTVYRLENIEARVTSSIGFATYVPGKNDFDSGFDLLKAADANLYKAKENGRACVAGDNGVTKPIKDYSNVENRKVITELESSDQEESSNKTSKKAS
jgi:diguanylate cyclase (GGDEF)-like protein